MASASHISPTYKQSSSLTKELFFPREGWVTKWRHGWLCGKGWVANLGEMSGYVEKDGLLCGEGWVAKQRGMGG